MHGLPERICFGIEILILCDLSYVSRFWTLFESWLAFQHAAREGLQMAAKHVQRYKIVCIHNAPAVMEQVLISLWQDRDTRQVYDMLSSPDITVTNQRDKFVQLPKVLSLNADVIAHFRGAQQGPFEGLFSA